MSLVSPKYDKNHVNKYKQNQTKREGMEMIEK